MKDVKMNLTSVLEALRESHSDNHQPVIISLLLIVTLF